MKRFWKWLSDQVNRWFDGSCDGDRMSVLCLCIAIILAGCATSRSAGGERAVLYLAALCSATYAIYRCFCKDRSRQKTQADSFNNKLDELGYKLSLRIGVWKIKRGYRYLKCKQCKHRYRIIKKKGKHTVTCPNCGSQQTIEK